MALMLVPCLWLAAVSITQAAVSVNSLTNQKHAKPNPNDNEKLFLLGVEKHDLGTVQAMLDAGVDINGVYGKNNQGITALHMALKAYDLDMMQFLLERGADVNGYYKLDGKYVSYLVQAAATREEVEILEYLHNWGADINSKEYPSGANALNGTFDCVNTYMGYKHNAMNKAIYLIGQGINIDNIPQKYYRSGGTINSEVFGKGRTPFLGAVAWDWPEMMELLANNGANINAKDTTGKNALQIALDKKNLELYKTVQEIMSRGQQPSSYVAPSGQGAKSGNKNQTTSGKTSRLQEYNSFLKTTRQINDNQYDIIKGMYDLLNQQEQISPAERNQKFSALANKAEQTLQMTNMDSLLENFHACTEEEKQEMSALAELRRRSLQKHAQALKIMAQNKELSDSDTKTFAELLQEVIKLNDTYTNKLRQLNKHFDL